MATNSDKINKNELDIENLKGKIESIEIGRAACSQLHSNKIENTVDKVDGVVVRVDKLEDNSDEHGSNINTLAAQVKDLIELKKNVNIGLWKIFAGIIISTVVANINPIMHYFEKPKVEHISTKESLQRDEKLIEKAVKKAIKSVNIDSKDNTTP